MRNDEVLVHNEFVDVVPTFLCALNMFELELIFPPSFMHLIIMLHA